MGIRLMTLEDFPQLATLWQPENMLADYPSLQRVLARNPDTCFVYEQGGQVIGAALGLYDGRRGILQSVAVLPAYRGQGYGSALISATIDALRAVGATRLRLFVYRDNAAAQRLYERLGFRRYDNVFYMGFNAD